MIYNKFYISHLIFVVNLTEFDEVYGNKHGRPRLSHPKSSDGQAEEIQFQTLRIKPRKTVTFAEMDSYANDIHVLAQTLLPSGIGESISETAAQEEASTTVPQTIFQQPEISEWYRPDTIER